MPTDPEILLALDELAQEARDPETLRSLLLQEATTGPVGRRRRRLGPALAAATCVLGIAVGVGIVATHPRNSESTTMPAPVRPAANNPCPPTDPPLFGGVQIEPGDGIGGHPSWEASCAGYRLAVVVNPSNQPIASVTLYAAGTFDTSLLRGTTPVSAHGIEGRLLGRFGSGKNTCHDDPVGIVAGQHGLDDSWCGAPRIFWQYAPNAWGSVALNIAPDAATRAFYGSDGPQQLLRIAAAVRPSAPRPESIPFRLRTLTDGFRPTRLVSIPAGTSEIAEDDIQAGGGWIFPTSGVQLDLRSSERGCTAPTGCRDQVEVTAIYATDGSDNSQGPGTRITVDGHPARLQQALKGAGTTWPGLELSLRIGTWWVTLTVGSTPTQVTVAQLESLVRTLDFGTSTADPTTWFPSGDLLPR
jgi:hypothetical protein